MLPKRFLLEVLPRRMKLYHEFQNLHLKSNIFFKICKRSCYCIPENFRSCGQHSTYFSLSLKRYRHSSSKKNDFLKNNDQVPSEFSLIYKAPLENYVTYGQRLNSLGILATVALGAKELYYLNVPHGVFNSDLFHSYTEFLVLYVGLVFMVTSVQLFLIRYPLRIYHNTSTDKYIAVFVNVFGLPTKMNFCKGQVQKLKPAGVLPWKNDMFSIRSKSVILLENYFRLPADYNALLNIKMEKVS